MQSSINTPTGNEILMKEALAQSELLYRSLFESMNEGFCLHEIVNNSNSTPQDYIILDANPAFEKIIGIKVKDAIGRYATDVYGVSEAPYLEVYSKVALTGEPTRFEAVFTPMQKTFSITVFSPSKGRFATIFEDITIQKQHLEELRISRERFKSIVQNSNAGYFRLDKNGILQDINPAWIKLYGYESAEEIIGHHFTEIQKLEDVEAAQRFVQGIMDGDRRYCNGEFSRKCKDGTIGYHFFAAQPVVISGEVTGIEGFIVDSTAKRIAEKELKHQRDRTDSILSAITDTFFSLDSTWRFTVVNPAAEKAPFRRSSSELLGKIIWELYPQLLNTKIYQRCFTAREHYSLEQFEAESPLNGLWYEVYIQGHEGGVNIYMRDISERKKAESTVIQNEARLRSLLNIFQHEQNDLKDLLDFSLNEAIKLTESKIGYIYFYNEDTREFTLNTWSKEVMKECTIINPLTVYDLDKTGIWGEAVRQRKPIIINDFEAFNPLKKGYPQGHSRLYKFVTVPVVVNGRIEAVIGVANKAQDYTESDILQLTLLMDGVWKIHGRITTEATLRESEFFFKESQRAASIGSYKMDCVNGIWESSEVLDAIFGIDNNYNKSVNGWLDVVHPDEREMMGKYLQEDVISGHKKFDREYRIIRKSDGEVRWVYGLGNIASGADGRIVSMIGTIQDITDRKKTEKALQNIQKLESLSLLAGGIAHDFNNLLGGIYGYIDMASELADDPKLRSFLSKAMSTMERGRDLTRQLITFSKGGAPVLAEEHLFPFLKETAQFALSGSNVSVNSIQPDDLWPCSFDKNQIGQVIDNIIINAKQAMPNGGTIEIESKNIMISDNGHPVLKPGKYVKISIKDHGIGMPREILPNIFDPFFTTKTSGHGLGLAMCFSIIKKHEGTIEVESQPGKGSTFHVFLPAAKTISITSAPKAPGPFKGNGLFVVMDDQEVMRDVCRAMLQSVGYDVFCVEDGQKAIDFITESINAGNKLSGAIFDLTIPGAMGGCETVAHLRRMGITFPVFAASGHADDPVFAKTSDFGFTGCIAKPFRKNDLISLLSKNPV